MRSLGDWSQVVSLRRKGEAASSDARTLGGSAFIDRLLSKMEKQERETLRLWPGKSVLPNLLAIIAKGKEVEASAIRSGVRKREVVQSRKMSCQIAVRKIGYQGVEVARFLGGSTSAANRLVSQKELMENERTCDRLFCTSVPSFTSFKNSARSHLRYDVIFESDTTNKAVDRSWTPAPRPTLFSQSSSE